MPLVENATIRKLRGGGIALGFGLHHLRSAAAGMIASAAGHDWLFIDMEHGAFSQDDVAQICVAADWETHPVFAVDVPCAGGAQEASTAAMSPATGGVATR